MGERTRGRWRKGGILENNLNLQIAKKTGEELQKTGVQVIYTRTEDEELGEGEGGRQEACGYGGEDRTYEFGRRPDLTVSIHQNSYTDPSVRGIQVFYYSGSQEGEWMARQMERVFAGGWRKDRSGSQKPMEMVLSPETDRGTDTDRRVWFLKLSGRAGSSDR